MALLVKVTRSAPMETAKTVDSVDKFGENESVDKRPRGRAGRRALRKAKLSKLKGGVTSFDGGEGKEKCEMENGAAAEWLMEQFDENQRTEIRLMFVQKLANIRNSVDFWNNKVNNMAVGSELYELAVKELEESLKNKAAVEQLFKALFFYDLP